MKLSSEESEALIRSELEQELKNYNEAMKADKVFHVVKDIQKKIRMLELKLKQHRKNIVSSQ